MSGVRYVNQYRDRDAKQGHHGAYCDTRQRAEDIAVMTDRLGYGRRRALIVCRPKPAGAPKRYVDEHEREAWDKFPQYEFGRRWYAHYRRMAAIRRGNGFMTSAENYERAAAQI